MNDIPSDARVSTIVDPDALLAQIRARIESRKGGSKAGCAPSAAREITPQSNSRVDPDVEFDDAVIRSFEWVLRHLQDTQDRLDDIENKLDTMLIRSDRADELIERLNNRHNRRVGQLRADSGLVALDGTSIGAGVRGSHALTTYASLLSECEHVVDLSCGSGELVEMLLNAGVRVTGVERRRDLVARCEARGLPVQLDDGVDFLERLDDESLDGIIACGVAERVTSEELLRLVRLTGRKLRRRGIAVIETMNPCCPSALADGSVDPDPFRPVPAEVLRFLWEEGPFHIRSVRFTEPAPGIFAAPAIDVALGAHVDTSAYERYAVIAVRH